MAQETWKPLIELCGIETTRKSNEPATGHRPLIELCGIETFLADSGLGLKPVPLIELCGIETIQIAQVSAVLTAFNRALWD